MQSRVLRFSKRFGVVLALIMIVGLTGCRKKPPVQPPPTPAPPPPVVQPTPTPPPPPPPPKPTPPPVTPTKVPTEDEIFAAWSLADLNAKAPLADVFFEYDKADLSEATRATLQKNSDYLRRWTSTRVLVEGHADSRGTNEYNLSLGERRAASVRDYLVTLGIPATRFSIVSKGEEEPACREENDACWGRNRRAHFIFTAK